MIGGSYWERNWKKTGGCGDEGDSDWGYGRGPSGCSEDIDRRGIGSGNALDDGRSGKPDDNAGEWTGEGPESVLQSTKTLLVEGRVPRQIPRGRRRLRCWRTRCEWIGW